MIYIPFIYFTALSIILAIKKKDFDVSVFMAALYAISSLGAILIVKANLLGEAGVLFTKENLNLRLVPTILFCLLPTITIIPFARIRTAKIKNITIESDWMFVIFSICLLLVAALNFYLPIDKYIDVIKNGTWMTKDYGEYPSYSGLWEAKTKQYNGELLGYQIRLAALPTVFSYIFYLSSSTILLLPCFFYSICMTKKKIWFSILLLLGSVSSLAISIQSSDRTEFVNYALMFVISLLIFKQFMKKRQMITILAVMIPITFVAVFYLVGVTKARFHTENDGETKAIIQYSGQSYLNFCYFYDNAKDDELNYERVFPLTNHFVLNKDYENQIKNWNEINGFKTDVFASFLGTFLLDIGVIPMILWILAFFALCMLIMPHINSESVSFWMIMLLITLAIVPAFGVFYYRYFKFIFALIPLIAVIMVIMSKIIKIQK